MDQIRLRRIRKKLQRLMQDSHSLYIVVSVERQMLYLCRDGEVLEQYACSTSRYGIGNRENSLRTPPGIHRIKEKYGAGAPAGRIFRDREDTGEDWDHIQAADNLILTRILRLEGMEEGINKGPGVDSYERYIYIHGTGREDLIGTPMSHGCVCMRNSDIIRLFDTVQEGTLVYIDPPPLVIGDYRCRGLHLVGIFGSGMSAIAQYLRFQGIWVSGSDRLYDDADTASVRHALEKLGCIIAPQDGSGIGEDTDIVCVSTAIEDENPDILEAKSRNIPILHRSDVLSAIISGRKTIAIAGTSGKSTVTAMIFEFLSVCEKSPSLITGAALRRLAREGFIGNAYSGGSELLVVEADESDGTIAKYRPAMSVILNVSKDHKDIPELIRLFQTLAENSSLTIVNKDDPMLASIRADVSFGRDGQASWRPDYEELMPLSVRLVKDGVEYDLPLPGAHNMENLRAALAVCEALECRPEQLREAVKNFGGVVRRFAVTETSSGIYVVDDYAHNPAKISAAIATARGLSKRIIAVYQPHGFGPTRFLKDEYILSFRSSLRNGDSLYLLPIYYAGGTAQKDISSGDIIRGLGHVLFKAVALDDREGMPVILKADAKPKDCVLIMGARDPSLSTFVRKVIEIFGGAA